MNVESEHWDCGSTYDRACIGGDLYNPSGRGLLTVTYVYYTVDDDCDDGLSSLNDRAAKKTVQVEPPSAHQLVSYKEWSYAVYDLIQPELCCVPKLSSRLTEPIGVH
ncbi:hypothetical protein J6590_082825 [Homalodisca vitripennis]|nr:hypothetical protein J6590_082825 [Homalodisca vitripennis]